MKGGRCSITIRLLFGCYSAKTRLEAAAGGLLPYNKTPAPPRSQGSSNRRIERFFLSRRFRYRHRHKPRLQRGSRTTKNEGKHFRGWGFQPQPTGGKMRGWGFQPQPTGARCVVGAHWGQEALALCCQAENQAVTQH
ncbi:hypothetical protein Q31b_12860 [Novipirellula aureliae]|uniref:DUF1720 domain-containing protein n=1 Tax=Novipirellula aureliae TaxID=2527966 RepID=A0A5C6E8E9_9BACT|nr:hypothetical protein Q31b_12860 [Novipirellula aureliae]